MYNDRISNNEQKDVKGNGCDLIWSTKLQDAEYSSRKLLPHHHAQFKDRKEMLDVLLRTLLWINVAPILWMK